MGVLGISGRAGMNVGGGSQNTIIQRTLGKTGLMMPIVSMGVMEQVVWKRSMTRESWRRSRGDCMAQCARRSVNIPQSIEELKAMYA